MVSSVTQASVSGPPHFDAMTVLIAQTSVTRLGVHGAGDMRSVITASMYTGMHGVMGLMIVLTTRMRSIVMEVNITCFLFTSYKINESFDNFKLRITSLL